MKFYKLIILLVMTITTATSVANLHKYYLSLTTANYVNESKSLQITSELFIDDFEKVLKQRYSNEISLEDEESMAKAKASILRYFTEKFRVEINGEAIGYSMLGTEFKDDKIVCYFEATNVPKIYTFTVHNELLIDLFPKQQNIVKLKVGESESSVLLVRDKVVESISLE